MQDVGVCYAFVEFEDMAGVHNAVKVCISLNNFKISIYHTLLFHCVTLSHHSVYNQEAFTD